MTEIPYSKPDIEKAFLGCLLVDAPVSLDVARRFNVSEAWFTDTVNRSIWSAIILIGDPVRINTLAVYDRLGKAVQLKDIEACVDIMVTSTQVLHYAEILRDSFIRRRLNDITLEYKSKASDADKTGVELIGEMQETISDLSLIRAEGRTPQQRYNDILDHWRAAKERKGQGLRTRWESVNKMLGGWRNGMVYVIAGRPGQGKSTLLGNELIHQAKQNVSVSLASIEMTEDQFCGRMLAEDADLSSFRLDVGGAHERDWPPLVHAASVHAKLPLRVYSDAMSIDDFIAWANVEVHHHKSQLLALDYLQIMSSTKRYDSRNAEVSQWMNIIRETMKRVNVPLLLVSQLRRAEDGSDNKKPKLGELRDSGSIEQNAAGVLFIHQKEDEKYDMVIAKHRFGPTGDVALTFNKARQRFEDNEIEELPRPIVTGGQEADGLSEF